MKKNIFTLLGVGALLLTASCSMDNQPIGSLLEDDAIETVADCYRFRNGFYGNIRACGTGGYVAYTELQMDMFIGTKINGNQQGPINNGDINASDGDIESIWGGFYGAIASTNFLLGKIDAVQAVTTDESDLLDLERYRAEAHFFRAYFYFWLLDHYCPTYSEANQAYGLPIVTEYAPTHIKDNYPSRSTQAYTYKFIEDELELAYKGLKDYEAVDPSAISSNSPYVCSWAVRALEARLALLKGDWPAAKTYAEEIINASVYPLATISNYADMWTKDTNSEVIFRPISTKTELGISSTGAYWNSTSEYSSNYIPVPYLAEASPSGLYASSRDIRYKTFLYNQTRNLLMEGALIKSPIFAKYMGNTALDQVTGQNSMYNMPKVFRMSEVYLIAAEANAMLGLDVANQYLGDIRKNRIPNYTAESYSGQKLIDEVRLERTRELIGEGFRMSDLRRWGLGFTREASNYTTCPQASEIVTVAGNGVTYQPNDYRYTWPIPATELQVNPHMAGQQNPGY